MDDAGNTKNTSEVPLKTEDAKARLTYLCIKYKSEGHGSSPSDAFNSKATELAGHSDTSIPEVNVKKTTIDLGGA